MAWRDAASLLLGRAVSDDADVLRQLVLPLLADPDPPAPKEPFPVNGGWVHADLPDEDLEVFENLRLTLPDAGAEELSAAAQQLRLAVLPYRSDLWSAVAGSLPTCSVGEPGQPRFNGSLAGIEVVDLTAMWAGPLTTRLLAEAGATVTKIDPECRPDGFRANPHLYGELNAGKEIIDVDLRDARDRETFEVLVASADLLVDSFSRRVLPNFGYGHSELRSLNPGLATVSIVGFPSGCPEQDWSAYGTGIHAISGLGMSTGRAMPAPVGYPDPIAGYAAFARSLEVIGTSSHSEVSLIESAAAISS